MDAASVINTFLTDTYVVTRRPRSGYTGGVVTPADALPTFTIRGCVQPASGRDLLRLPEGRRAVETRVLYTATELLSGGEGVAYEADRVTIEGDDWEVQNVEPWRPAPGDTGYVKVIVQAVQLQASE